MYISAFKRFENISYQNSSASHKAFNILITFLKDYKIALIPSYYSKKHFQAFKDE